MTYTIQTTSVSDRENLVAELWEGDWMVAEISREKDRPVLEIYPRPNTHAARVDLNEFVTAVLAAKDQLRSGDNG